MPPSSITLALVSPLALTLRMPGWLVKNSMTVRRLLRRGEQVNVADDLLATAAGCPPCCSGSRRDARATFPAIGSAAASASLEQMSRGVGARRLMPSRMFVCVFSPKPSSSATLPALQAASSCLDGFDAQLVVQRLDLLRAEAGDARASPPARRDGGLQFLVIRQLPGGDEFGDLLLERLADAFDFAEPLFGDEFVQRFVQALQACARRSA